MEVPLSLLEAIAGMPEDEFDRGLLHLQAAEFLYEAGHLPSARWRSSTRSATRSPTVACYGSGGDLSTRRSWSPSRTRSPAHLDDQIEILAHHAWHGEVWEKAFVYLRQAGDKARQAHATQEAIAFYTHAIEASEQVAPTPGAAHLLPVYEGRGLVWMLLTNYEAAIADFSACARWRVRPELAKRGGKSKSSGVCALVGLL